MPRSKTIAQKLFHISGNCSFLDYSACWEPNVFGILGLIIYLGINHTFCCFGLKANCVSTRVSYWNTEHPMLFFGIVNPSGSQSLLLEPDGELIAEKRQRCVWNEESAQNSCDTTGVWEYDPPEHLILNCSCKNNAQLTSYLTVQS